MVKLVMSRKRQRTREALEEAALGVIADKGFDGASLDEIAARAGVTKGAIYSNYRSKGELLWEAAGRRSLHLRADFVPGADFPAQARPFARALMALMTQSQQDAAFHAELQRYIRTDPELQARQVLQYRALFDGIGQQLEAAYGDRLTMPARGLALAIQALCWGFLHQWSQTPEEVTEDVIAQAYEALAIGATTPR